MSPLYRYVFLLGLGAAIACSGPAEHPGERAPNTPAQPANDSRDSRPPSSADPDGPRQGPRDPGPLEEIVPGTFVTRDLSPKFTVFSPFDAPFADIDRGIGERIQSMYKTLKEQGWEKDGPALVVVRGSLASEIVSAEVTFTLGAAASNAEEFGLKSGTLPGGLAVVGMHGGSRASLDETNKGLDDWCSGQGKKPRGDLRWFVFLNRPDQVSLSELLTAVIQPIE